MNDPIITVDRLAKRYHLRHQQQGQRYVALRDVLAAKLGAPLRWVRRQGQRPTASTDAPPQNQAPKIEDFWALDGVSFEVKKGEVVGIIGRNGAGKSTLLKVLSRITEPTRGRVTLRGSVGSLLEVGTGFHPELTGRENVYLNGALLGMRRAEIRKKFDAIVAFADVERFLDTPVKRYSSGMYVRLAFAVAAHLEPDILVVDEVLAVGDAEFQKKCLGKMRDISRGGRTVIFVSHNISAIQALCSKAIWLKSGVLRGIGGVDETIASYISDVRQPAVENQMRSVRLGDRLELTRFDLAPSPAQSGGPVDFEFDIVSHQEEKVSELVVLIYSSLGARVAIMDLRAAVLPLNLRPGEKWTTTGRIEALPLVEGEYSIGLYVVSSDFVGDIFDLASLTVTPQRTIGDHAPYAAAYRGVVELAFAATHKVTDEHLDRQNHGALLRASDTVDVGR